MIKVICVGTLKESYWKDAMKEYQKRLTRYTKLELIEVPDFGDDLILATSLEKDVILKHLNPKDYIITLEIEGKQLSSVAFSEKIEACLIQKPNITFTIGGSHGLHQEIKEKSDYALSFSNMTFPHQLFRIMLLEQIYRSFKISHHENYHK